MPEDTYEGLAVLHVAKVLAIPAVLFAVAFVVTAVQAKIETGDWLGWWKDL